MARFEILVFLQDFAVRNHAAADTGAKSEIDVFLWVVAGFAEGAKISVVFNVNRFAVFLGKLFGDIETSPREIAEPGANIVFNNAGHRDGNNVDVRDGEVDADVLNEVFVEQLLVLDSLEFERI